MKNQQGPRDSVNDNQVLYWNVINSWSKTNVQILNRTKQVVLRYCNTRLASLTATCKWLWVILGTSHDGVTWVKGNATLVVLVPCHLDIAPIPIGDSPTTGRVKLLLELHPVANDLNSVENVRLQRHIVRHFHMQITPSLIFLLVYWQSHLQYKQADSQYLFRKLKPMSEIPGLILL